MYRRYYLLGRSHKLREPATGTTCILQPRQHIFRFACIRIYEHVVQNVAVEVLAQLE